MKTIVIILFAFILTAACGNKQAAGNGNSAAGSNGQSVQTTSDTPTEAYKRLYSAVKSKNTEAIKKELTKQTVSFGESVAGRQNSAPEKIFENGFTATTFSESMPEIRDERVSGNMGAVEVYNSKESKWEDLPFILEDGQWKLAIGEMFAGSYKQPGKGRAQKEADAANAAGTNRATIIKPNVGPGVNPNAPAHAPSKSAANNR